MSTEVVVPSEGCPTQYCRYALLKLLGPGGEELGQGAFVVEGGRGRRRVELSVGGEWKGAVAFDLKVRVRRKGNQAAAGKAGERSRTM